MLLADGIWKVRRRYAIYVTVKRRLHFLNGAEASRVIHLPGVSCRRQTPALLTYTYILLYLPVGVHKIFATQSISSPPLHTGTSTPAAATAGVGMMMCACCTERHTTTVPPPPTAPVTIYTLTPPRAVIYVHALYPTVVRQTFFR